MNEGLSCKIRAKSVIVDDPSVSYGVGQHGSVYGDGQGYVKLAANAPADNFVVDLGVTSVGYVPPYGPFHGEYTGAGIIDGIEADTRIDYFVEVRDNAGHTVRLSETNIGCKAKD